MDESVIFPNAFAALKELKKKGNSFPYVRIEATDSCIKENHHIYCRTRKQKTDSNRLVAQYIEEKDYVGEKDYQELRNYMDSQIPQALAKEPSPIIKRKIPNA